MFQDNFKKELDSIQADQHLLSRTRQKIALQENQHKDSIPAGSVPSYAKRRQFIRAAAAAVCSLLVLTCLGLFLGSRTGMNLTSALFSSPNRKDSDVSSPGFLQVDASSSSSADSSKTDSGEAVTAESGAPARLSFHDGGIYNFGDYESILSVLEKNWARVNNGYNFFEEKVSGDILDGAKPAAETFASPGSPGDRTDGTGSGISDYSQTNIQVKGVDEADIIKNDGEYIYCIFYSSLYVLDVRDPQNMKVAAILADNFSLTNSYEYYLDLFFDPASKTLSVISNSSFGSLGTKYPQADLPVTEKMEDSMSAEPFYGGYSYSESTKLQTYDASDPYSPKEIRTFYQDGYYISSRRIDNTVYLVTSQSLWYDSTMQAEDLMPSTSDGTGSWTTIPAQDIYIVNPDYANTFTVVSAIDTRNMKIPAKTQAVVGQGTTVYASADTLYITAAIWDAAMYPMNEDFTSVQPDVRISSSSDQTYKTKILAFSIKGGTLAAKASGTVNGSLLNQYSMDEYKGNLRIATTSGGWTSDTSNNVFVLNANLNIISSLTDLAPGEQIYSARFAEDRIYLVTFLQVDPFFVIDASDPNELKVLGKLKIPGYSNYLQMLGDNKVLAVGNSTYVNGGNVIPAGLKIAVFDVSDPANPILQSSLVYGDTYGYSDVQYNPKALLLNQTRGLLGLPVSFDQESGDYGMDYITGYLLLHFDSTGNLTHDYLFKDIDLILNNGMCRGVYINDTIFLVGYTEILAYSLDTYELIGSLSL